MRADGWPDSAAQPTRAHAISTSLLRRRDLQVLEELARVAALPHAADQRVNDLQQQVGCSNAETERSQQQRPTARMSGTGECATEGAGLSSSCDMLQARGIIRRRRGGAVAALLSLLLPHLVGVVCAHQHKRHVDRAALEEELRADQAGQAGRREASASAHAGGVRGTARSSAFARCSCADASSPSLPACLIDVGGSRTHLIDGVC